ncbi:MAG TPA: PH domain-containing protein [Candidatus Bathyarchaeia archaeon]|nr:PH domain-containing protein [Candidatus Bathyarchaeia archaeon]
MTRYGIDPWEHNNGENKDNYSLRTTELAKAVEVSDQLIEKVRRFFQSGDYDEVILSAHRIQLLYRLCLEDEFRRQGRVTFNPVLRARIEKNATSLDHWWELGVIEFQKMAIGPEIARIALTVSDDMHGYITAYVNGATPAPYLAQASRERSYYDASLDAERISTRPVYPLIKGGLNIDDEDLIYLARPSILGCTLRYEGFILLLIALLLGSFFVQAVLDVGLVATVLRGAAVLLFLFIAARVALIVYSERYGITARDILVEKGLFLKKTAVIPLNQVTKRATRQSLSGKLLKTGNVFMKTAGGQTIVFQDVYDPDDVASLVAELQSKARAGIKP